MKISVDLNLDLWVARDSDGKLYVYKNKPKKGKISWLLQNGNFSVYEDYANITTLEVLIPHMADYFDFSQVQWEDEPKQLKDILRG